MSNERESTDQNSGPLEAVERTLAAFSPATPQIDRDRPAVSLAAASPKEEASTVDGASVPIALAATSESSSHYVPANNYLRTREVALRMGLDAIGAPRASGPASAIAPTYGNLLHDL